MESTNASDSADAYIELHSSDDMVFLPTDPISTSNVQLLSQREVGFEPGLLDQVVNLGALCGDGFASVASLRGGGIDESFGSERGRFRVQEW